VTSADRDFSPQALRESLNEIAAADSTRGASPAVEERLRAHVRTLRPAPVNWRVAAIAVAASVAIVALVWHTVPEPGEPPVTITRSVQPASGFLPLPYAHVPVADGQIVRMTVRREALVSFGFDPGDPALPDVVEADVFIGEDGIARSVRFVDSVYREELTP